MLLKLKACCTKWQSKFWEKAKRKAYDIWRRDNAPHRSLRVPSFSVKLSLFVYTLHVHLYLNHLANGLKFESWNLLHVFFSITQFEDFANHNAFEHLARYGTTHLVFIDDIQVVIWCLQCILLCNVGTIWLNASWIILKYHLQFILFINCRELLPWFLLGLL